MIKTLVGKFVDITLFLLNFAFIGLGILFLLIIPGDYTSLITLFSYSSISFFGIMSILATYYMDHRFGSLFNQYLLDHNASLINVSGLPDSVFIKVKFFRGAIYAGAVLSYTFKFKQLMYQQRYIVSAPNFRKTVQWYDQAIVLLLTLSFLGFLIGLVLPQFFN